VCLPKQGGSFGLDMKGDTTPPPAGRKGGELILNISKSYEDMIRIQFDSFCRKILREELIDYMRHQKYRLEHEVSIAEILHSEIGTIGVCDEYPSEYFYFKVKECDVRIENALLAKALMSLSEEKRQIVLLSYFFNMSDQKIADDFNAVRRTIQYKRTTSLKEMKRLMEVFRDEE
jgi:RNA polymerase sigma factor (sigma-70 family)